MARYSRVLQDQNSKPIVDALISVTNTADGTMAALTDDSGVALANPFRSDIYGSVIFNVSGGFFDLSYQFGGHIIGVDRNINVGGGATLPSGSVANSLGTSTTIAPSQGVVKAALDSVNLAISQLPNLTQAQILAPIAASSGSGLVGHLAPSASIAEPISLILNREPLAPQPYRLPGDSDWTAAINRVCAIRSGEVRLPPIAGGYLVSDQITMHPQGNYFVGDGCDASYFTVAPNFNLGANGVVFIPPTASEQDAGMDGVGFQFTQPGSATTRASLVAFPPAIYARDVTRMRYGHLKISGAYKGVDFLGNTGGLKAEKIEIGALYQGFVNGGALDWYNIDALTFWPYGFPGATLQNIYFDGNTQAARLGRSDGCLIGHLNVLGGQVIIETTAGIAGFGKIEHLSLDTANARLDKGAGAYSIGSWYASAGATGTYAIAQTAGTLTLGAFVGGGATGGNAPLVQNIGGIMTVQPGEITQCSPAQPAFYHAGGYMIIDAPIFSTFLTNQVRTAPIINSVATSGGLILREPVFFPKGTGSGPLVTVLTDLPGHYVRIPGLAGWPTGSFSFPAGGAGWYPLGHV